MTENKKDNSRSQGLIVIGLALLAIGIATANPAFLGVGVVFFVIGLAQRDQSARPDRETSSGTHIDPDMAFELYKDDAGTPLGQITGVQLQFLIDNLEEEFLEDQDYAITYLTLGYLRAQGGDPDLMALLDRALGDSEEVLIIWKRAQ